MRSLDIQREYQANKNAFCYFVVEVCCHFMMDGSVLPFHGGNVLPFHGGNVFPFHGGSVLPFHGGNVSPFIAQNPVYLSTLLLLIPRTSLLAVTKLSLRTCPRTRMSWSCEKAILSV